MSWPKLLGPHYYRSIWFILAVVVGTVTSAVAQPANRRTTLVFYTENDDWPPDTGTDKNYTNGLRVTLDRNFDMWRVQRMPFMRWIPSRPDCFQARADQKCTSTAFHVGQQFYTPDDITRSELIPNDRPYAGWLYVGGSWRTTTVKTLINTDVYLGVTGPLSLAKQTQTAWHSLVGAPKPAGWDHQIGNRVGLIIAHSRRRAFDLKRGSARWLELAPYAGGNVGNVITDAYGGGRLKIGYNLSRDWSHGIGPILVASLQPAAVPRREPQFEIYAVLDGQGRALAYNAFIDAAPHHQLKRRYLVADGGVGIGVRLRRFTASYRMAFVTPEYDQAIRHDFKALRFMIALN